MTRINQEPNRTLPAAGRIRPFRPWGAALLGLALAAGCASLPKPENYASKSEWMKAVQEYRKQYLEHPTDYEIKMKLEEAELNAAEAFYEDGMALEKQGSLDDAIYQFREGLSAMPDNEKIANTLQKALALKEATTFYQQAVDLDRAGKEDDAKNLLTQALDADPENDGARALLEKIKAQAPESTGGLVFSSREPVSLHFNHTDLKAAFDFIGRSFGINVLFDGELKEQNVTLSVEDVTFEQALDLILHTTQTFSKPVGPNTILVADDTPDKHAQYDDLLIKDIQLNSVRASDMANFLKSVTDLKHLVVNDQLNTLTIRDTADKIKLAQEVIEANDRPPAEVLLDVEILEVDRSKAEQLGMDYGQSLQLGFPAQTSISGLNANNIDNTLGQVNFTLPALTLNYFKQDVDAKTLAHPQIRTLDSKEAKIHIGDRVPLASANIQPTNGGVLQTTYTYSDIGVLLDILPVINLDRTVQVKLSLEVSSLGPNIGTSGNPAYEILTRDADSTMLLHDGESAVLGGLIQDDDSKTHNYLPIIGDFPILGDYLAGNVDNSDSRTDIILTITPHIVRDWSFPHKELQEIYSGTQNNLSSKPLFSLFDQKAAGNREPKIALGPETEAAGPTTSDAMPAALFSGVQANSGVVFAFDQPQYEAELGQGVELKLYGENLGKIKTFPLAVAFNASYLKFASASPGSPAVEKVEADSDEKHGMVRMTLTLKPDQSEAGPVELADIHLNGYTPGISYLMFLNPTFKDENGNDVQAQAHASRIVVK